MTPVALFVIALCWLQIVVATQHTNVRAKRLPVAHDKEQATSRVLVTVAYAEPEDTLLANINSELGKPKLQQYNLNYFIRVGIRGNLPGTRDVHDRVDFTIVVNGNKCTPCDVSLKETLALPELQRKPRDWVTVIKRQNKGMDFGAFAEAIKYMQSKGRLWSYSFFVFLNSSTRGPFLPKWTPPSFHFVDALIDPMLRNPKVKCVTGAIACLPSKDPAGRGAVAETLYFGLDRTGLKIAMKEGVFYSRDVKAGTIMQSEYGVARALFRHGYNIDTLLSRYASGIDWTNQTHWTCNDNMHPTRRGSYGGISMHPFETVFVKLSWCVRSAEIERYSAWNLELASGGSGTKGNFDDTGYEYGISECGTRAVDGSCYRPDVPDDGCTHGYLEGLRVV